MYNVQYLGQQLQEMESEAKVAPVNYRTQMISKIRHYHTDIEQISRNLVRLYTKS